MLWEPIFPEIYNGDPLFINDTNNFQLQTGSPAIDSGITIGVPYNSDVLGISRPQGSALILEPMK